MIMPIHLLHVDTILDTVREVPNSGLVEFLEHEPNIQVSVALFQDLMVVIEDTHEPTRSRLNSFLECLLSEFGPTAIAIDMEIAKAAGALRAFAQAGGRELSTTDAVIAATAVVHGAVLVTSKPEHFEGLGINLLNPFGF